MTEDEYVDWYPEAIAAYAAEHIKAGSMPADKAHEMAAKQFADLLPDGLATPAHHLLVGEADGGTGSGSCGSTSRPRAKVSTRSSTTSRWRPQRGKGYGRAIMEAAEHYSLDHRAATIKLHIFGDNTVARSLYESLGYVARTSTWPSP